MDAYEIVLLPELTNAIFVSDGTCQSKVRIGGDE